MARITPLDIINKQFTSVRRGYDPAEVSAFLEEVRDSLEESLKDVRRLEGELRAAQDELANKVASEDQIKETNVEFDDFREVNGSEVHDIQDQTRANKEWSTREFSSCNAQTLNLQVMIQKVVTRVEALETALHRKDRRCAFLERCLARCKGGSAAIRAVEESDRARRLAAELDAAMRQLDDRSALNPPTPPPTPPRRRRPVARTPTHDARNTLYVSPRKSARKMVDASRVLSPARPVPASPAALARRAALRPPSSPSESPRSVSRTPPRVRAIEEASPAGMSLSLEEIAGLAV